MSQLLQNAAYGTALILTAALLRRVLKDRLVPEARLALWAVCLFRLLTPAAPRSVLSLWRLFQPLAPADQPVIPPPASNSADFVPAVNTPPIGAPAVPAPQPAPAISWETVLLALWLTVSAALAVRYVISWLRTRREVARAIPVEGGDPRYDVLPHCARLREGVMEGAPLTFGVVRPTVVLSPSLEGEALDCVLVHEGVHARRRDNLWHYAMALALTVHWWNPAVWLMARLLRRDIELSCDRAAVRLLGADRRAQYANTLVSLSTQTDGPHFTQSFGRKATEERILSIMKFKKTTVIGVIFSLTLVLALTAAFASEPKDPKESDESNSTTSSSESIKAWGLTANADNALTYFSINVDYLEDQLAQRVADGAITREEADRVLFLARTAAQTQGSNELECTISPDSGLVNIHFDENGDYRPGFNVFYKAPDGSLTPLDPATLVCSFVFPAGQDTPPSYVELGKPSLDLLLEPGPLDSSPDLSPIQPPLSTADPGQVPGNICARINCGNTGVHTHDGVTYAGWSDKYVGSLVCTDRDCNFTGGEHHHEDAAIYPHYDLVPAPLPGTDLFPAIGTKGEEGYVRQSDLDGEAANVTNPQEALAYMEWLKTQPAVLNIPLYDAQGKVIGQFAVDNPTSSSTSHHDDSHHGSAATGGLCTLPDCGNTGVHTHNGVTYSGWAYQHTVPPAPANESEVPIGEQGFTHDPVAEDSAGMGGEPIACPPEAIDQSVQPDGLCGLPTADQFEHHSETHHSNGHHN